MTSSAMARNKFMIGGLSLALLTTTVPACAQVPCAAEDSISFAHFQLLDGTVQFTPLVVAGINVLGSVQWAYFTDTAHFTGENDPVIDLGPPGQYPVCLGATLVNDMQAQCVAYHCELITVLPDSGCGGVNAAFTISFTNDSVLFIDQSTADAPVNNVLWDFGDGLVSSNAGPMHEFLGAGPYEVCLTVVTDDCSSTVCKWLYLGPPGVPCYTLVSQRFDLLVVGTTVALLDQSTTTGMNSSVLWEFGDGTSATGAFATHTYPDENNYSVCQTLSVWGPLTSDTCTSTTCLPLFGAVAGVDGAAALPRTRTYPVPFNNALHVEGAFLERGDEWTLHDALGRAILRGLADADTQMTINTSSLAPGTYVLRMSSAQSAVLRVMKQ